MAFLNEYNSEQKQHINLSPVAMSTLENDMIAFSIPTKSGMLNKIIMNYHEIADASISIRLSDKLNNLQSLLESVPETYRNQAIEPLMDNYKRILLIKSAAYPDGKGFKFRINNDNMEYLSSDDSCKENQYYPTLGKYLKALVEEYSRRSFLEREAIMKSDMLSCRNSSIIASKQIKIKFGTGKSLRIKPYRIAVDAMQTSHYILGIIVSDDLYNNRLTSIRISSIKSIHILQANSRLKKTEIDKLESAVIHKGVPFIGKVETDILVYLNDRGKKKYQQLVHLRPAYIKIENNDFYTFNCSIDQARFYFYRFGEDAKIIQPKSLALHMKQAHQRAADIYQ